MRKLEASWLGALVGGEGYLRYHKNKSRATTARWSRTYHYWGLRLEIEMAEEEWVRRAAEICGVNYHRLSKGTWEMVASGYRALEIVKEIRPYLLGCKARAADMILSIGATLPGSSPRPKLPCVKKYKGGPEGT